MGHGDTRIIEPGSHASPAEQQHFQEREDSIIVGSARHGRHSVLCIKHHQRHAVSYRAPAEDSCTLIFDCLEGPAVLPCQKSFNPDLNALKSTLISFTEPSFSATLAINLISLKMLYAIFVSFILIFDMEEEERCVGLLTFRGLDSYMFYNRYPRPWIR